MGWVLAIDFGTSSTAAAIGFDGGAQPVGVDGGLPQMLSNVFWQESTGTLLLGDVADNASVLAPWCFERAPKRKLGQEFMLLGDQRVPVARAVGAVLGRVAQDAVRSRGGERPAAVRLTHPVRWGEATRAALLEAAAEADLGKPELVMEPVGAAMHYASHKLLAGEHVAVYDLGGGTFDTAVLARGEAGFEVVGVPGGRSGFGGEEFDDRLYRFLGEQLPEEDWIRLRTAPQDAVDNAWPKANRQFQRNVRRAKELLTNNLAVTVDVPSPVNRELVLTVGDLNALIRRDVEDSVDELARTVRSAGLEPDEVAAVYLAGGSSQIPLVRELIGQRLGIEATHLNNPKAVICLGAAIGGAATVDPGERAHMRERERAERERAERERAEHERAERERAERERAERERAERERADRERAERERAEREGREANAPAALGIPLRRPAVIFAGAGAVAVVVSQFLHYFGTTSAWSAAPKHYPVGITLLAVAGVALIAGGVRFGRPLALLAAAAVAPVLVGETFWLFLPLSYTHDPGRLGTGFWMAVAGALVLAAGATAAALSAGASTPAPARDSGRALRLPRRVRAVIGSIGAPLVIVSLFLPRFRFGSLDAWSSVLPTRYPVGVALLAAISFALLQVGVRTGRRTALLAAAAVAFLLIGETFPLALTGYSAFGAGFWLGFAGAVLAAAGAVAVAATVSAEPGAPS